MMRTLIADQFGVVRDELTIDLASVSWVLNGIGRVQFRIAASDAKATPENLQPSNRVLIQFANGLPDWGGVIDLPRVWDNGIMTVNAYSIEHLLQYRLTDRSTAFDGAPAGAILARVLQEMNATQPEGITLGQIWLGGQAHHPRYNYKNIWQIVDSIHGMEKCDIVFRPVFSGGRITFIANLLERWGEDKSDRYALVEGANISSIRYEEQGPLCNAVVAAGAGTTWTDRQVVRAEDNISIQRYGLRERLDVYADVTYTSTLEMHARNRLAQAYPLRRFGLEVVDAEPARFSAYDVGDILLLQVSSAGWGYSGKVRVVGREFRGDGRCILAVDEWGPEQVIFIRDERSGE